MALEKRISELTPRLGAIKATDLMVISEQLESGYGTKSVTGLQIKPYKTYLANISQTGASAPTVNYSYSELTSTITWAYISTGLYEATLSTNELTTNKTFLARGNDANDATVVFAGLWRNTNAISSITLTGSAVNLSSGSTFTLYGIKAA